MVFQRSSLYRKLVCKCRGKNGHIFYLGGGAAVAQRKINEKTNIIIKDSGLAYLVKYTKMGKMYRIAKEYTHPIAIK
jgi:hypothetical protein